MAFAINERHDQRFVDRCIRLSRAMGIDRLLRGPVFYEYKPPWLGSRVVGVKAQASWLLAALAHGLCEMFAKRRHIGSIFSEQQNGETNHPSLFEKWGSEQTDAATQRV